MYDPAFGQALLQSFLLAAVVFAAVLLAQRRLLPRHLPQPHPAITLPAVCLFLAWFVIHFGRHQFGGYDFSLLMETGWRQWLGQRPYVDFPTTTPPGFNLCILRAFRLFGVSWDANLYLASAFTCVTFLWLFWLFRRLDLPPLAALGISFAIQCAANLLLCFWWYNNSTLTLAAIAFLSTLLYARTLLDPDQDHPPLPLAQLSLVVSLGLLALFKPNLAALVIVPAVLVLLIVASRSIRTLVHTFGLVLAAASLTACILALNHISIPLLLSTFHGVAAERGLTLIGFGLMQPLEKLLAVVWLPILSFPLLTVLPRLREQLRARDLRAAAVTLFLFIGPIVALYGVAANGEFRSVECIVLLAADAIAVFAPAPRSSNRSTARSISRNRTDAPPVSLRLHGVAVAILCAAAVSDLYQGVIRLRVAGIGPHLFFEWSDNSNLISSGVLRNMRVSRTMLELEREVAQAVTETQVQQTQVQQTQVQQAQPGDQKGEPHLIFFGPRIDFNYAVCAIPSPAHLPAWWQPGTSFPRSATPALLATWNARHFTTLIFLKEDTTYYPQEFLDLIAAHYTPEPPDRYPALTVYHRNPGS